jgi:AbiTii-like protein
MPITCPIAQVEQYALNEKGTLLQYGERFEQYVRSTLNQIGKPALSLTQTQFQKIIEVVRNRLFDWVSELPDEREPASTRNENLTMPDRITLKWLWQYVPIHFWFWFSSLIVSAFVAGVFGGQLSIVEELVGKGPRKIGQPTPSEIASPTPTPTPSPRALRA